MSDAEALFPGKTVVINGEEIVIKPYSFVVCMTKAGKYARSIARSLTLRQGDSVNLIVMDLIADSGDDVLALLKLAIEKPTEWWGALQPDQGIELTAAVLECNKDFFSQRLKGAMDKLTMAIGAPSLPDSSEPATPSTPSSPTA
jgi:hypothetical protein